MSFSVCIIIATLIHLVCEAVLAAQQRKGLRCWKTRLSGVSNQTILELLREEDEGEIGEDAHAKAVKAEAERRGIT